MKLTFAIPRWLMKIYLTELGATEVEDDLLIAEAWQASIHQGQPVKVGSLVVGRIEVEFSGDESAIESILPKLNLKTFRAGG
jgi:hypothetical protein